ncbi:hypothetical protein [Nocardia crassostreae]|uniref:hypothetical protein n=1 Tax=Nocardia crassostreae TaxID=53428 RepID=UPI0008332336|nr:hypothetical protein [Nocardia crassostreae]
MGEASDAVDSAGVHARAEAVSDVRGFGALIAEVADLAGLSRGDVWREMGESSSVYQWFRGETLPAKRRTAHQLAACIERALDARHPDLEVDLGESILAAWDRLDARRRVEQAARAKANRRRAMAKAAGEPDAGTGTEEAAAEQVPPIVGPSPEPARRGRRLWRTVPLLAMALVIGSATGFGVTRAVVVANRPETPPCAEAVRVKDSYGFIQLNIGFGPVGDPAATQRIELRVQVEKAVGWVVYGYLARATSEHDDAWLEWSHRIDPTAADRVYRCPGATINKVRQTPGVRARDDQGGERWFRTCATVPAEFQVPGRTSTNCTSWNRPDD